MAHTVQPSSVTSQEVLMGTLSKRTLRDFGIDLKERIEDFRTTVGGKLDHLREPTTAQERRLAAWAPWFVLAGASFVGALTLKALGRNHLSLLVGQWVPTFLLFGLYRERSMSSLGKSSLA